MLNIATPEGAGISNIPPEILGEIFVCCLSAHSWKAPQNTQQLLSSVCTLWRTVALSTPALWASLNITCSIDTLHPPLPVIRTHLQRSGTHPLSFSLHVSSQKYYLTDDPRALSVLMTLADARQRWCSVYIRMRRMTQDVLDLITQGGAPLLRGIKYHILDAEDKLPIPLCMAHDHPRLESFQWNSSGSLLLPLGSTQLTSLSLRMSLTVSQCITILRLSPRLSRAEFRCVGSVDSSPAPHLTHSALHTINIEGLGGPPEVLLNSLTLPALLNLVLKITYVRDPSQWDVPLATFLERSNPPLRELSLSIQLPSEPTFVRILTSTPHLRVLKMFTHTLPAGLIRTLHPQAPPGTSLCPRLRRLDLSAAMSGCLDGLCGAMLRARWGAAARANGVACLERVDIEIKINDDDDHNRDLAHGEELRAEGMQGMIFSSK